MTFQREGTVIESRRLAYPTDGKLGLNGRESDYKQKVARFVTPL
jgi:hypothetical protein